MLIRIALTDADLDALTAREHVALENIGSTLFYGQHVALSSRPVLSRLAREPRLSERARAAFKTVLAKAADMDAMERSIDRRIEVSRGYLEPRLVGSTWEIPLALMSDNFILNTPAILAENLEDAKFYTELARWYKHHLRMSGLTHAVTPVGGGGSTTGAELEQYVSKHLRFVLCIVDSDREYPNGPLGQTAKQCLKVLPSERWYARLEIMDVREIENLLPQVWLRRTKTGQAASSTLDELRFFDETSMTLFRRHIDLKVGVTACQLADSADPNLRALVKEDLVKGSKTRVSMRSCTGGACGNVHPCARVNGLGNTLVTQVVEWLQVAKSEETKSLLSDQALLPLAKMIFEWGAASSRVRV